MFWDKGDKHFKGYNAHFKQDRKKNYFDIQKNFLFEKSKSIRKKNSLKVNILEKVFK